MNILEQWYKESTEKLRVFSVEGKTFVLHKGFKLTRTDDNEYFIEDVRKNDFYSKVTDKDFLVLEDRGFVEGAAFIMYNRDKRRCAYYKSKIEKLYADRVKYKKLLSTNTKFYSKKIRNVNDNVHDCLDLMFLYGSRVEQYEYQYKLSK